MLCVNTYPQDYIDECRARVQAQVAVYKNLIDTARQQTGSSAAPLDSAIEAFEPVLFNNMVLLLDNLFCHRSRMLEKKDGNPLNEVRMLCNSLLYNNSRWGDEKGIKHDPAKSVLKYQIGDEIRLSEADFIRLSNAFFAEIEVKYLEVA